jgi:hypothetical protein
MEREDYLCFDLFSLLRQCVPFLATKGRRGEGRKPGETMKSKVDMGRVTKIKEFP